ncbi:MAG: M20/M25/M40 family metallo-hydrolase, partial [Planctomycetes bacterium]|nr:M20/M25/M40 family metallo-hydrolase [Planctomycetota bacterium]
LLSAHMDTVPLARGARPVVKGERIVPQGPTALGGDDRSGVAAVLTALLEVVERRLDHPPLTFLFTVREESGLQGAAAARIEELARPELGFNFDGGPPEEVTIGATGAARMEVTVKGVAAHAGVHPERGVSAIAVFADAVARLDRGGWHGLVRRPEGTGTSNVGTVRAGEATNVVCDRLEARAEARSHDPEFLRRIAAEYRAAFEAAAREHRNEAGQAGVVEWREEQAYHAFALAPDAPAVKEAFAAAESLGLRPRTRVSNGGLDANWLVAKGIPTVTLGCGQREIHTTGEYLLIEEHLTACRLALRLATG